MIEFLVQKECSVCLNTHTKVFSGESDPPNYDSDSPLITRLSRWSSMIFTHVPSLQMLLVSSLAPVIIRFDYGELSGVRILIRVVLRASCRRLYISGTLCVYTQMK